MVVIVVVVIIVVVVVIVIEVVESVILSAAKNLCLFLSDLVRLPTAPDYCSFLYPFGIHHYQFRIHNFPYSLFSVLAGFTMEALIAWELTVSNAISKVNPPVQMKTLQWSSVL